MAERGKRSRSGVAHRKVAKRGRRNRLATIELAHAAAQRVAGRLALLQDVTASLSGARDLSEVAGVVADRVREVLGAAAVTLRRVVDGRILEIIGAGGVPEMLLTRERALPLDGEAPAARAARFNEAYWEEEVALVPAGAPGVTSLGRAYAVLPLTRRGKVLGTLSVVFADPRTFDLEERTFVVAVAHQCAQALERAALFDAEVQSRALLDAIFQNAPIGIAFLDREYRFARVNPKLAETNGLSAEAHVGKTVRELFPGLPVAEIEASWREVLRTGKPVVDHEISGETPAAPGKVRTWLESWYPVRSGDEILGLGALVREVTAEREAEEFRQNVLGIVGHDLRNPLTALTTSAQLLLRADDLTPERARLVGRILSNAGRMNRIIAVLADYARVRGGQAVPLRLQRCDVSLLAEAVAEESEMTHPGREVRLRGEGDPGGEWDPDRVTQALSNIVSNALDYSPAGVPVELTWRGDEQGVTVEVANSGPPIPPEVLPRVFEPFLRGEQPSSGRRDGLGLGLFIAKALVVAHGGRIEARSEAGGPTIFSIHLPRRPPASP